MIQSRKECIVCRSTRNLHRHHIFYGSANRKNSERFDLTCWLCQDHHESTYGVHGKYGENLNRELKELAQREFEKNHTREEFVHIFGRNYIDDTDL